jgi:3-isopropylmalate dehydrogenase
MAAQPKTFRIAVIRGDGIGVDVTDAAIAVIEAARRRVGGFSLDYEDLVAGAGYYGETGRDIAPGAEAAAGAADGILLGAIGLPSIRHPDGTEIAPHLRLREMFQLYAGVRPIKAYPNAPRRLADPRAAGIDLVVLRESTEGLFYSAAVHGRSEVVGDDEVRDTLRITRPTTEKLHDFAFRLARKRKARGGQGRVTCVDKANVFHSMAFFRKIFDERARNFPDIEADHNYVDAQALDLIRQPWVFDVLVMENMFGDILSDLGGGLVGGMGMASCAERRRPRPVPAGPRQRARHHGPGQGQPPGGDPERRADAGLLGRPIGPGRPGRRRPGHRARRGHRFRRPAPPSHGIRRRPGNQGGDRRAGRPDRRERRRGCRLIPERGY